MLYCLSYSYSRSSINPHPIDFLPNSGDPHSLPLLLFVTRHSEFETTLNGVTVQDVRLLVEAMNFVDENMTACVGVTAPTPPPGKMMRPSVIRYAALLFNIVCCVVFQLGCRLPIYVPCNGDV